MIYNALNFLIRRRQM